jgi:4'-phosphopantetheinyl transferase
MGFDVALDRFQPAFRTDVTLAVGGLHLGHVVIDHDLSPDPGAPPLTDKEWQRAARYRRRRDRDRYVQTRIALRTLLGRTQGIEPGEVVLTTGLFGKPELAGNYDELTFNLSHSGDDSLIAIARGFPVGVDIERDSTIVDTEAIARHFFTPGERSLLETASPGERRRRFLAIWTAKEAYAKGLGLGFALDPTAIEVRPVAGGFRVFDSTRPKSRWWVRSLRLGHMLVGALASPMPVPCLDWSGRP